MAYDDLAIKTNAYNAARRPPPTPYPVLDTTDALTAPPGTYTDGAAAAQASATFSNLPNILFNKPAVPAATTSLAATNASVAAGTAEAVPTVTAGMRKQYQQGDVRKTETGVSAPQTPPGVGGNTSPGGVGYNAVATSQPGIQRVNVTGASPLFTNLDPGVALDDLNNKRATPLPSALSFLNGVQEGSFAPANGNGVGKSQSALIRSKSDDLLAQADSVASSGGIVDLWKARGMRRTADRLATHADALANTEVQAASVANQSQEAAARNKLGYAQITSNQRGQDMQLAPHLADITLGNEKLKAVKAGDLERARDLSTLNSPRNISVPKFKEVLDPVSGKLHGFYNEAVGASSFQPFDPVALAAEQKKQAAAAARAGK